MMKIPIPPRDLEILNTYLDDQLPPRKRDNFEARLENEPGLVTALAELRKTRAVLRTTPRLRAPHNFTLTPEMVGRIEVNKEALYPKLRLASAVAGFLFIMLVVGDFLGFSAVINRTSMDQAVPQIVALQEMAQTPNFEVVEAPAPQAFSMESTEIENNMIEEEVEAGTESNLEEDFDENTAKIGVEEIPEGVLAEEIGVVPDYGREMAPEEDVSLEDEEQNFLQETPFPVEETQGLNDQRRESEQVSTLESSLTMTSPAEMGEVEDWGENTELETGQQIDENLDSRVENQVKISIVSLMEIVLGSLAVISGAFAWFFKRQR
jgi:hypothetical protein